MWSAIRSRPDILMYAGCINGNGAIFSVKIRGGYVMDKISASAVPASFSDRVRRINQHLHRFDSARDEFRARLDALARVVEAVAA